MAELGQNDIVEITSLKVQMATMQADMRHLADTMDRLQRALESTSPRGDVAALEKRHVESEQRMERRMANVEQIVETRMASMETVVGELKDVYQQGKGGWKFALTMVAVIEVAGAAIYAIWSNSK